jgi:hypothetical protein
MRAGLTARVDLVLRLEAVAFAREVFCFFFEAVVFAFEEDVFFFAVVCFVFVFFF